MTRIIAIACLFVISLEARAQTDPVPKLIKQLKNKKADKRSDALMSLADLGPKAAPAVDALAGFLPALDEEERILATMALGKIGKASLPAVEKLLAHEDETTRFYAVWTVGLIGKDAKGLTPRLLKTFADDEEEDVRIKSAYALARVAPDSKDVLTAFTALATKKGVYPPQRMAVIEELRHFGTDAIEPLIEAMKEDIPSGPALESLGHLLENHKNDAFAQALLPHLPGILSHRDVAVSEQFTGTGLTFILSKHGEKLLPELQKKLADKDRKTQIQAQDALCLVAAQLIKHVENPELVKKIVKVLGPRFTSPDTTVRLLLAQQAPLNDDTQPAFIRLLLDDDMNVRQFAVMKFQQQGIDAMPMLQAGRKLAKEDDKLRYACAMYMLTGAGDAELQKLLWQNLKHKDPAVRHRIALQLAVYQFPQENVELAKKTLLPVVMECLKSDSAERRLETARLLPSIQMLLPGQLPALLDRLDDPSPEVRLAILSAIPYCAREDVKRTLKAITPLAADADASVRQGTIIVLSSLGKDGVPLLIQIMEKEKEPVMRAFACDQLGNLGKDAEAALPAILKLAEKEEHWQGASFSVVRIAPEKGFSMLIGLLMKRDEALRKAIPYPQAVWESPTKLSAALLKDWKTADVARSGAIAQALAKTVYLLAPKERDGAVLAGSLLLSEQLKKVDTALKAKESKERLAALAALGELRGLNGALNPVAPDWQKKEWMEWQQRVGEQGQQIEQLLARARMDSDLQVRRAARKLQSDVVYQGFGFPPPVGIFPAFGPNPPGVFPGIVLPRPAG